MALWHDLYPEDEVPETLGEMSREAWTLRKRGVDILRLWQDGEYHYLVVQSILDSSLTCMAVQRYLMSRWDTKYIEVRPYASSLKAAFEFKFLQG